MSGAMFYDAGTNTGALVTRARRRRRTRHLRFRDAHAALDWCIARAAQFVYFPAPDTTRN